MTFGLEQAQAAIKDWPAPWVLELGLEVEECRPGFIRARQPFNPRMTRVVGAMSGQAIMAAIDTVMVIAVQTVLDAPMIVSTVTQSTNFLRPIGDVDVIYEVSITKSGRTLVFGEAHAYEAGQSDRLAATATMTYAIPKQPMPESLLSR